MSKIHRLVMILALLVPLFAVTGPVQAEEKPDATLTFKAKDLGYLFRVEWGNGRVLSV